MTSEYKFQIIDVAVSDNSIKKTYDDFGDDDELTTPIKGFKISKRYQIRLYGVMEDGTTICAKIPDFKPYFFIELPFDLQPKDLVSFKSSIGRPLRKYLEYDFKKKIEEKKKYPDRKIWKQEPDKLIEEICEINFLKRKKFYNFTNNELFPFLKISFHSNNAFYTFRRFFENCSTFSHFRCFGGQPYKLKLYESNLEPVLRFFHIQNISPSGWVRIPRGKYKRSFGDESLTNCRLEIDVSSYKNVVPYETTNIAPMLIASFDIECSSGDGSFPDPDKECDKVIQIGTTFHRYGQKECFHRHMVTLGDCLPIDNVELETADTEAEVIQKWCKMLKRMKPNIITGYNIWGFDWLFLYKKAENIGNHVVKYFDLIDMKKNKTKRDRKLVKKKLASSALGSNFLSYLSFEGIVQIDFYKVAQANFKLDSYKLDKVAQKFLGENKVDLPPKQLFEYFKIGTPDKIRDIAVYCIQDCALVNRLIIKLETIANNIGMSNVCSIPLSYLFLRGQGIKIFSLVAKQCRDEGFLVEVVKKSNDRTGYEGAIVLKPKPGIYFEPVAVLDYASLYPSSMIAENVSHDSIVCHKYYSVIREKEFGDPETDIHGNIKKGELHHIIAGGEVYKSIEEYNEKYKYDNLEGYSFNEIEYNVYKDTPDGKDKYIYQICVCRFAEKIEEGKKIKAVLPRILQYLLSARKRTRKQIKYKTCTLTDGTEVSGMYSVNDDDAKVVMHNGDIWTGKQTDIVDIKDTYTDFEKAVWDGLQLAYKVTANSLYGQVGASTSPICYKQLAASTTAIGREHIYIAKRFCEDPKNFPFKMPDGTIEYLQNKSIYGDSVTGDTPLILRNKEGKVEIRTIESLSEEWKPYEEFKPFDTNRREKQQAKTDYQIWTNGKWANIHRVIRHKTKKRIFRVNTHSGVIDVTEDHSLLNSKLEKIKPKDCIVGETKLAHSFPTEFKGKPYHYNEILKILDNYSHERSLKEKEAFIKGFFFADGSCGYYNCKSCNKYSWALNNQNRKLLNMCLGYLVELYGDMTEFKILETMKSSNVLKLVPKGNIKCMVKLFRDIFYDKDKFKIIPNSILNSDYNIRLNFFLGYYMGDGSKFKSKTKNIRFSNKGKIGSAQLYYLIKSLGYKASINIRKDKLNIYRISCCINDCFRRKLRKNPLIVKKMLDLGEYDGMVYDIETSEGCFNGGVGEIVLKNTDSVFISFDTRYPDGTKMKGDDALKESIRMGLEVEKNIQKMFKAPQKLEYEKTFYPFVIFSKKRYIGNKYEFDTKKYKQTSMGIVLKRRDNAPIVKKIYGGIMDQILNERDIDKAKQYYINETKKLLNGEVEIKDLVISKTLNANYSNPVQIAHKMLADRVIERNAAIQYQSNDRIPFVYIDERNLKCNVCNDDINTKECKCRHCLKLFCPEHLEEHKCHKKCRFCGVSCLMSQIELQDCIFSQSRDDGSEKLNEDPSKQVAWNVKKDKCTIKRCCKCDGIFCNKCMIKHTIVLDKYKKPNPKKNKCVKEISRKLIQGDIVETIDFIKNNKLMIDYRYYLDHQILNPVSQIFDLEMDNSYELIEDLVEADNDIKGIISKKKRAQMREEKRLQKEKDKEERRIKRELAKKEREEKKRQKEIEKAKKKAEREKIKLQKQLEKEAKQKAKKAKKEKKNKKVEEATKQVKIEYNKKPKMKIIKVKKKKVNQEKSIDEGEKPKPPKIKARTLMFGTILKSSNRKDIDYIVIKTKGNSKRWQRVKK